MCSTILFLRVLSACPSAFSDPDEDRCEDITVSVGLFIDDEPPHLVRESFQDALIKAIESGRLQETLDIINPTSPVTILSGLDSPVLPEAVRPRQRLSGGATAGLSVAAVLMVGFIVGMFVLRQDAEAEEKTELVPVGEQEVEPEARLMPPIKEDPMEKAGDESTVHSGNAVLGATKMEAGTGASGAGNASASGSGSGNDSAMSPRITTASSAGSSGWSSLYESSVNTSGSYDQASGSRLVDLSADSGVLRKNMSSDAASLADLDAAIQTGDWAA